MLATARDGLVGHTYFKGTFNVIRFALLQHKDSAGVEQIQDLVFFIFEACEVYLYHILGAGGDKRQVKQIGMELEEFMRVIRGVRSGGHEKNRSFPGSSSEIGGPWAAMLASAENVHSIVQSSFPHTVFDSPFPTPRFREIGSNADDAKLV